MKKKRKQIKSYEFEYDKVREGGVFRILDSDSMYPCYWYDDKTDQCRKIIKTRNGKIQMV